MRWIVSVVTRSVTTWAKSGSRNPLLISIQYARKEGASRPQTRGDAPASPPAAFQVFGRSRYLVLPSLLPLEWRLPLPFAFAVLVLLVAAATFALPEEWLLLGAAAETPEVMLAITAVDLLAVDLLPPCRPGSPGVPPSSSLERPSLPWFELPGSQLSGPLPTPWLQCCAGVHAVLPPSLSAA